MKKTLILTMLASIFAFACNNQNADNKTENENQEGSKSEVNAPQNKDEKGIVFYKATGNEPGWSVELDKRKSGTINYSLVMNYGDDNYKGKAKKVTLSDSVNYDLYNLLNDTMEFSLKIVNEQCIDDGDIEYATTAFLSINGTENRGCGNYK